MNPYVGPIPFKTGQRLFGREREVAELRYLLTSERIALLYSPSGAGKTSIVQAGLIPKLEGRFDIWGPTRVNTVLPGDGNRYVRSAIYGLEKSDLHGGITLAEYAAQRPREHNPLIIFDQFEEMLRVDPGDTKLKDTFFGQLADLLRDPEIWALFILREDYLAPLDRYAKLLPSHLQNRLRIDRLTKGAAIESVEGPAQGTKREFAPGVVNALVENLATAGGEYIEPLQLQVVCRDLWDRMDKKPHNQHLIETDDIGDVGNALKSYYDKAVEGDPARPERVQRDIREWFQSKLLTPDLVRSQVRQEDTHSGGLDNALVSQLLDTYLIRPEPRGKVIWYELSHDRLTVPVNESNKAWLEKHLNKLQKAAALWLAQAKKKGLLVLGSDLQELKGEPQDGPLKPSETEFLGACQAAQDEVVAKARQTRVFRILFAVVAAALLVSVVAGAVAYQEKRKADREKRNAEDQSGVAFLESASAQRQKNWAEWQKLEAYHQREIAETQTGIANRSSLEAKAQSRLAESGRLAATASQNRQAHLDLASLLNIEAMRIEPSPAALSSLKATVESNPRFITALYHPDGASAVAFSPDGKLLVTGCRDKIVRLWDVSTHKQIAELKGHTYAVQGLKFSEDGQTLASVGAEILLWHVASRKLKKTLIGQADTLAFSRDGKTLASSFNLTIQLWDAETGIARVLPPHGGATVRDLAFSHDSATLAAATFTNTVQLWDVNKSQWLRDLQKGAEGPLSFSPDGKTLATGGGAPIRLWDYEKGTETGTLSGTIGGMNSMAFSGDGSIMVASGDSGPIQLWDVAQHRPLRDSMSGHSEAAVSVAINHDGSIVASASPDQTVRLWSVIPPAHPLAHQLEGMPSAIMEVAYNRDGTKLALGAWADTTFWVWDIQKRELSKLKQPLASVVAVAFSRDGTTVASALPDFGIRLWDAATLRPGDLLKDPGVTRIAYSGDGKTIASGSGDQSVRLWSAETHQLLAQLKGHSKSVASVAFSPDSRTVASGSADRSVRLWDVANRRLLGGALEGHKSPVNAVAFSPDGRTLASGGGNDEQPSDDSVCLWDVATHRLLGKLEGHTGRITDLAFSPDGGLLVSSSLDNTMRLWDVATHRLIGDMTVNGAAIFSIAFHPNGKTLVSAGAQHGVWEWDLDPQSWISRACARANRNLSRAEWNEDMGTGIPYHLTCPNFRPGAP